MSRVAFVVQRYGADVTGGSEALARAVAERLPSFHDVTVFTTRARDYVTWRNELAGGEREESGVRVLRFPVEEERDLDAFNAFAEPLYARPGRTRRRSSSCAGRGRSRPPSSRRCGRRRTATPRSCSSPTSTTRPTGGSGRRRSGPSSCPRPTTSRRSGSPSTARCSSGPGRSRFLTPAEQALVRARFGTRATPRSRRDGRRAGQAGGPRGVPRPPRARRAYALYAGRIDAGQGVRGDAGPPRALPSREEGSGGARPPRPAGDARAAPGGRPLPRVPSRGGEGGRDGGGGGRRVPEPLREPLDRAAGGPRPRHPRARERRLRRC